MVPGLALRPCYNRVVTHAQGRETSLPEPPQAERLHGPCVLLWHPDGRPESPKLAEALRKRGLPIRRVADAYAALAQACRIHGPVSEGPAATPVALVLSERDRLSHVNEVILELERHAPHAVVWSFEDAGGRPALKPVVRRKTDAPTEPTVVVRPNGGLGPGGHRAAARGSSGDPLDRLAAPNLRLTDVEEPEIEGQQRDPGLNGVPVSDVPVQRGAPDGPKPEDSTADNEDSGDVGTSLSDEELDMLLGETGSGPARPGSA